MLQNIEEPFNSKRVCSMNTIFRLLVEVPFPGPNGGVQGVNSENGSIQNECLMENVLNIR